MFLQNLAEASEVESLIVLQQNEAQVEFAEGQLQVVQLANVGGHYSVTFVTEHAVDTLSSAVTQSRSTGMTVVVVVMGQEVLQFCFQVGILSVCLRQLLYSTKCLHGYSNSLTVLFLSLSLSPSVSLSLSLTLSLSLSLSLDLTASLVNEMS